MKVLGILGGLGPMATVYFYEMITRHTGAACDQEHIDIVISSRASTPDRTAFILGECADDPFCALSADAARLVSYGAEVLAIPCNTAHYFHSRLQAACPVPILNMVELTMQRLQAGVYQRACERYGLSCAVLDAEGQKALMGVIYDDVKQGRRANMAAFGRAVGCLEAQGCQRVVLGCTELSLVKRDEGLDGFYLDAMEVLAGAAIRACGKEPVGF